MRILYSDQGLKREDQIVSLGDVNSTNHDNFQALATLVGASEGVRAISLCSLLQHADHDETGVGDASASNQAWRCHVAFAAGSQVWMGRARFARVCPCHFIITKMYADYSDPLCRCHVVPI